MTVGVIYLFLKFCRTNLPKEVMGFPDFPFKEQDRSYLHADEVLQYLEAYADAFDVRRLIKVNSCVTNKCAIYVAR